MKRYDFDSLIGEALVIETSAVVAQLCVFPPGVGRITRRTEARVATALAAWMNRHGWFNLRRGVWIHPMFT